jgi:hypothetical protein
MQQNAGPYPAICCRYSRLSNYGLRRCCPHFHFSITARLSPIVLAGGFQNHEVFHGKNNIFVIFTQSSPQINENVIHLLLFQLLCYDFSTGYGLEFPHEHVERADAGYRRTSVFRNLDGRSHGLLPRVQSPPGCMDQRRYPCSNSQIQPNKQPHLP